MSNSNKIMILFLIYNNCTVFKVKLYPDFGSRGYFTCSLVVCAHLMASFCLLNWYLVYVFFIIGVFLMVFFNSFVCQKKLINVLSIIKNPFDKKKEEIYILINIIH